VFPVFVSPKQRRSSTTYAPNLFPIPSLALTMPPYEPRDEHRRTTPRRRSNRPSGIPNFCIAERTQQVFENTASPQKTEPREPGNPAPSPHLC
jgi:hypothetical protein